MPQDFRDVDTRELRLPSLRGGADPFKLIEKLTAIQHLSPNVRFGQLLADIGFLVEDETDQSLWDVEDARLMEIMEKHRAELLRRRQTDA